MLESLFCFASELILTPTKLVGFIGHENPQIRLLAAEHLVPYSTSTPSIFKVNNLEPISELKILVADHPKIAEHALTNLINLTGDADVLKDVASDDKFLELLFLLLTVCPPLL